MPFGMSFWNLETVDLREARKRRKGRCRVGHAYEVCFSGLFLSSNAKRFREANWQIMREMNMLKRL